MILSFAIIFGFATPNTILPAYDKFFEEKVLESGLAGYAEYKKRVRYKVVPFAW